MSQNAFLGPNQYCRFSVAVQDNGEYDADPQTNQVSDPVFLVDISTTLRQVIQIQALLAVSQTPVVSAILNVLPTTVQRTDDDNCFQYQGRPLFCRQNDFCPSENLLGNETRGHLSASCCDYLFSFCSDPLFSATVGCKFIINNVCNTVNVDNLC